MKIEKVLVLVVVSGLIQMGNSEKWQVSYPGKGSTGREYVFFTSAG
jgi:hypothetical protein